ncbi:MAG: ATP-binding protein [Syntrophomonas sp.]
MIKRLKYKFVLINMVLITMVLMAIFIAVYASTQQRLVRDSMDILQRTLMEENHDQPIRRELAGPKKEPGFTPAPTFVVTLDANNNIVSAQGNLFDLSNQESLKAIVKQCLANDKSSGIISGENLRYLKQVTGTRTKIAFMDRSMESNTLSTLIITSILVGVVSLGVFFLISLFLGGWALRPVEKAWAQQRKFVADASHELRTPLSVILANAGIVLSHPQSTIQDQAKWIEYIQMEANRMNVLVENLLFLARSDDAPSSIVLSRLNLSETVYGAILPFESVVFEQEKELEINIAPEIYVNGNEDKLRQLLAILLDNAIKYSHDKGKITVSIQKTSEHQAVLSVINRGVPIPHDQIEHIFDRFYRVDESRAREQGGYGLGLAIAQSIVLMHNAEITVKSSEESGTIFAVTFNSLA